MKKIIYTVLSVIVVSILFLILRTINDAFSLYALGISLWGTVPWAYVAAVSIFTKSRVKLISILVVTSIVEALGIGIMIDTLFIHLDAQGGLVFIFLPLWELILFVLITPLLLISRKK